MEAGLGRVGDEHEGQGEVQAAGVKENDVVVAVDADVAARGLRPSLAYYLEKLIQGADLMFFERIWGWERHNEIMAGSYMVRNTNKSRRFLYQWADVELRKPPGFHSADNGAIHLHLMEASGLAFSEQVPLTPEGVDVVEANYGKRMVASPRGTSKAALPLSGRQCAESFFLLTAQVENLHPYFEFVGCARTILHMGNTEPSPAGQRFEHKKQITLATPNNWPTTRDDHREARNGEELRHRRIPLASNVIPGLRVKILAHDEAWAADWWAWKVAHSPLGHGVKNITAATKDQNWFTWKNVKECVDVDGTTVEWQAVPPDVEMLPSEGNVPIADISAGSIYGSDIDSPENRGRRRSLTPRLNRSQRLEAIMDRPGMIAIADGNISSPTVTSVPYGPASGSGVRARSIRSRSSHGTPRSETSAEELFADTPPLRQAVDVRARETIAQAMLTQQGQNMNQQVQTNMVVSQVVENREQYNKERNEIVAKVRENEEATARAMQVQASVIEERFTNAEKRLSETTSGVIEHLNSEAMKIIQEGNSAQDKNVSRMKQEMDREVEELRRKSETEMDMIRAEQRRNELELQAKQAADNQRLEQQVRETQESSRRSSQQMELMMDTLMEMQSSMRAERKEREDREREQTAKTAADAERRDSQIQQLREGLKERTAPSPASDNPADALTRSGAAAVNLAASSASTSAHRAEVVQEDQVDLVVPVAVVRAEMVEVVMVGNEIRNSEYGLLGAIPKIKIQTQSDLDRRQVKYDRRDFARFVFNKTALQEPETQAKNMRNTKIHANALRLAVGSMMSEGTILETVHEQYLVVQFLKLCHDATSAKLMRQRKIVKDDDESTQSFDHYMTLVCVCNPAKSITFMENIQEWSILHWKKRPNVSLLEEVLRVEETANDCGFSLNGLGCPLMQQMLIWEEIAARVDVPESVEDDILKYSKRTVVTYEELLETAVQNQNLRTRRDLRKDSRTVPTINEAEVPSADQLQAMFPEASTAEINALCPKFGAGKKFGGPRSASAGAGGGSSGGATPFFNGKCAKCGQFGHMARHCPRDDACTYCGSKERRRFNCPNANIGNKDKPEVALARFTRNQRGKAPARDRQRSKSDPNSNKTKRSVGIYTVAVDELDNEVLDMARVVEDVDQDAVEDYRNTWWKRRSEVDTGFNREYFDSIVMISCMVAFWLEQGIQLSQTKIQQEAHTAGGRVILDSTTLVVFRNEKFRISGVAEGIAIDDRAWTGKGASSLMGMVLKNFIELTTVGSKRDPHALLNGIRIELEDAKYHLELFEDVTAAFAQRVRKIAGDNRSWSLEKVVYAADAGWHTDDIPLVNTCNVQSFDFSTTKINSNIVDKESIPEKHERQIEEDKFPFKFPNVEVEPPGIVHGYRRIVYGTTRLPANRSGKWPDSQASTRVSRDLDSPFGEFREIDYAFTSKAALVTNRPIDRVRSLVVDYYFKTEHRGAKPLPPPYIFDLPITEEEFEAPVTPNFMAMLRPPMSFNGLRVISMQRGDTAPQGISQRYRLHQVPKEFNTPTATGVEGSFDPSPLQEFQDNWSGIAKCVIDRVRSVPQYASFRREIEKTLSEKGAIAIVLGDGLLDCVAIAESMKDGLAKNRIRHQSLIWSADLRLKRITAGGELVPYGVTERTDAELHFDHINRTCRKDPRFGLTRRQLVAFAVAKAIARRTGERGMTKMELMLEAARELQRYKYEDVEKACEAVMLTSTRHFRYSANPMRMVRGTWLGVDVKAVAQMDTTFLMQPWSETGLALVNVVNAFDKCAVGEVVGPKQILLPEKVAKDGVTKKALNAYVPGVDFEHGHPTGADVTKVAALAILHNIIIRLLLVDPGPENIVRALALLLLGLGMRLRVTTSNSPRMAALIERLQLTIKTQLESYRHDPYLSKLILNVQAQLCHLVRNERIRQSLQRKLEPEARGLELKASLPILGPESDSLVFWSEDNAQLTNSTGEVVVADAQAVERGRLHLAQQTIDPEFRAKIAKVKEACESLASTKEPLHEGELVRYKVKSGALEPATVVTTTPDRNGNVFLKPVGAASKAIGVRRGIVKKCVDSDLSYAVPADSIEITATDLPYLPTLLEQIRNKKTVARVTGPFTMRTCTDCGQRRAILPRIAAQSRLIRCKDFKDTYCGDISDDVLEANAGWITPRVPREGYVPSKWLVPVKEPTEDADPAEERRKVQFDDQPQVQEYVPKAESPDGVEAEEEDDLLADEELPAELLPAAEDEVVEPVLDTTEQGGPEPMDISKLIKVSRVLVPGGGARVKEMTLPHVFDLQVRDFAEIVHLQQLRVNKAELAGDPNISKLQSEKPLTFRDKRVDWNDPDVQAAKVDPKTKPFESFRNWIVDDSIFLPSLNSREPSEMAAKIVAEFDNTGGPNVADMSWLLFVGCLTSERRWYLDEVTTVWGEAETKRLSPDKVVGDHPERRAFTVYIHKQDEGHFFFSRSANGAYGAVRFEVDSREAVCEDSAEERLFSIHRKGFTAGWRKKLRKGSKLPDFVPEELIQGEIALAQFMVHAVVKELRGTLTGTSSAGVPCVVVAGEAEKAAEAAGVLHSGGKPLTSRFLFDVKFYSELFVILKCRWAPGGHLSSKEKLELSENGSPTPSQLEAKLVFFSGNAIRVPRPWFADVPRAFNDSVEYAQHERPRATITHRGKILDAVIEEAMRLFEELEKIYIWWDSEFIMNISQYGSLEGAAVFWLSNKYKFRKNQIMPSLSSPCVYRIHDDLGALITTMLEFVDDFLGMTEAASYDWLVTLLGKIYPRLTPDLFTFITSKPSTVLGREVSFHQVAAADSPDGRDEVYIQVDSRNKIGAMAKFESDDEQAKRPGDLDRLLTREEVERLRSVRGECLYVITDWRADVVYVQKVVNFGNDESRTVRYACRQNLVVELLQLNPTLGLRFRLDLGVQNLVFILLVDAGFQARPHKEKTSKDPEHAKLRNRGVLELLTKESQEYSDAKLTNMRAMTALGLYVTSEAEFRYSTAEKKPMRGTLLAHGLDHSDDLATSSGSAEMGGYLQGIEHTEIAKRKLQDIINSDRWAGVERRQKKEDLTWSDDKEEVQYEEAVLSEDPGLILDLATSTELDLLDSEVVIRRTLSRTIAIKGEFRFFSNSARVRAHYRHSMRRMVHITDRMNTIDALTKYQPAENVKMEYLREMMQGRFWWYKAGDKKQVDQDGVFGKVIIKDYEYEQTNEGGF
eukprot:g14072.t1